MDGFAFQAGPRLTIKVTLDKIAAGLGLFVTLPLLAAVGIAVRLSIGHPVFYIRTRPGRHEQPFQMVKFRTMVDAWDSGGHPLPDSERITRLGRFLRATSLDELPQLWNVLRGDLSFVGPRPLLMEYLPRYTPEQRRRHDVLPGITGWAQVHGRNLLSWDEKFALDIWYVEHWSLGLDLRILLMTVRQVLRRQGIHQRGHATMPVFEGSTKRGGAKRLE
jgi:lipopolysaccharide/colanic/teichoic acid biosynthesis glycosyltransferase